MALLYGMPGNTEVLGGSDDLANFLYEPRRESLAGAQSEVHDLQNDRCVHCIHAHRGPCEVDHLIPWPRYPRNLVHNLAMAHLACNGSIAS